MDETLNIIRVYYPEKQNAYKEPSKYQGPDNSVVGWKKLKDGHEIILDFAKYISPKTENALKKAYQEFITLDNLLRIAIEDKYSGLGGRVFYLVNKNLRFSRPIYKIEPEF